MQDEGRGADGDNRSILDAYTIFVAQNLIVQEGAREAGGITQRIDQFPLFVA